MKNTKRRFETFSFFDHTGISAHLEKMAAEGLMIEKITNFGWIYQRIEPKTIHFAVSYYPKASEFDPEPSEEQLMFHEFCAHTGWKLACTSAQIQIFYNENENPTPIETDPELELDTIHASVKKTMLPTYLIMLFLSIMNGVLFVGGLLSDPLDLLSSPSRLFTGFAFVILFLLCSVELISYFIWYKKARLRAVQGEFLKVPNTSRFQKGILIALVIALFYWGFNFILGGDSLRRWVGILMSIYMPMLFLIVNGTKNYLKKKKVSKRKNFWITMLVDILFAFSLMGIITFVVLSASSRGFFADKNEETYEHGGMTWVIHKDELPLTLEDLAADGFHAMDIESIDFESYIKEKRGDESLLLGKWTFRQRPRMDVEDRFDLPQLDYTIILVKLPALYDICKKNFIKEVQLDSALFGRSYRLIDAPDWGAQEVYQIYDSEIGPDDEYLLCYEDVIVEIEFNWELTDSQKHIVNTKLNH